MFRSAIIEIGNGQRLLIDPVVGTTSSSPETVKKKSIFCAGHEND